MKRKPTATSSVKSKLELAKRDCGPCENGEGRLKPLVIKALMKELPGKWKLKGAKQLEKSFKFKDFKEALDFTNQVGEIAEAEGHHPDVYLTYGGVRLQLSSHEAKGLTVNDFILAAKIEELE